MSGACTRCSAVLGPHDTTCSRCGAVAEPTLLPELRPEAEPPLPAAHEALRSRTPPRGVKRRDPTPPHPAGESQRPTPSRGTPVPTAPTGPRTLVAAVSEPVVRVKGPLEDPSAWFDDSSIVTPAPSPLVPIVSDPPAMPAPAAREALAELERDRVTRRARKERSPTPVTTPVLDPPEPPTPTASEPSTVVQASSHRRIVLVLMLLVAVAVVVWWLATRH